MPSSPNYKRDYKQEYASESPKRRAQRAERDKARRTYTKLNGTIPAGFDVDHVKPLSKGGSNAASNLALQSAHSNRSYPRTRSGKMKSKRD